MSFLSGSFVFAKPFLAQSKPNLTVPKTYLDIDFLVVRLYNYTKIITVALLYHTQQYLSIERITIMDDPDLNAMRRMIADALKKCNDIVLLDFIYQLVTKSNRQH